MNTVTVLHYAPVITALIVLGVTCIVTVAGILVLIAWEP